MKVLKLFKKPKQKFQTGGGFSTGGHAPGAYNLSLYKPTEYINQKDTRTINAAAPYGVAGQGQNPGESNIPTTSTGDKGKAEDPGLKIDMDKLSKLAGKGHTAAVDRIIGEAENLAKELQNVTSNELMTNPAVYAKVNKLQDLVGPSSQNMLLRQVKETDSQWAEAKAKKSTDSYVSKDGRYIVQNMTNDRYEQVTHEDWLLDRMKGQKATYGNPLTNNELKSVYDLKLSGRFGSPEASYNKLLGYNVGKEYIQDQLEKVMDNISASSQKSDNKFFQAFGYNQYNESMLESVRSASKVETNSAQVEQAVRAISNYLDPSAWETLMAEATMKIDPGTIAGGSKQAIQRAKMAGAYQVLIDYFSPKRYSKTESLNHKSFDSGATSWMNAPRKNTFGDGEGGGGGSTAGVGAQEYFARLAGMDPALIQDAQKVAVRDSGDYSKVSYLSDHIGLNPEQQKFLEGLTVINTPGEDGKPVPQFATLDQLVGSGRSVLVGSKEVSPNSSNLNHIRAVEGTPRSVTWRIPPQYESDFNNLKLIKDSQQKLFNTTIDPVAKKAISETIRSIDGKMHSMKKWYAVVKFVGDYDRLEDSGILNYSRRTTEPDGRGGYKVINTNGLAEPNEGKSFFNSNRDSKLDNPDGWELDPQGLNTAHTFDALVEIPAINMSDPAAVRKGYYVQDAMNSQINSLNSILTTAHGAGGGH